MRGETETCSQSGDRGSYHQTGRAEGQESTHFLFLKRCLVWPRKGEGHRAGVGPVIGLGQKWSPHLRAKLPPRIVVKGEGWGWRWEVGLGFNSLAWFGDQTGSGWVSGQATGSILV